MMTTQKNMDQLKKLFFYKLFLLYKPMLHNHSET
jgi:hypothetical protein